MAETDLASIGLDALDAHEAAEEAKGKGDDNANDNDDNQATDDTKGGDDSGDSNAGGQSDDDGQSDSGADSQAGDSTSNDDQGDDQAQDDQVADDQVTPPAPPESKVDDDFDYDKYKTAEDYVKDKLPEIEIRGSDGDDGEIKTFKVKDPSELPDDFVPENHRDMLKASQQFGENGTKRAELAKEFTDKVYAKVQSEGKANLEKSWLGEIDELIAEKRLQPITAAENTEAFAKDPAAQRITQISDFMVKENARLIKAGNPYRISSIRHALTLLEAQESRDAANKKAMDDKKAEEDANSKRGGMIGGGDGGAAKKEAPRVRPGMTIDDILDSHDELT